MKKITVLIALFLVCFTTASMAQRRTWTPEEMAKMKEKRKTTYVDSLGVTSAIADSIVSIEESARTKMMDFRKAGGQGGDMRSQMKTIQDQKNADVKKIVSDDVYAKYIAMEERSRGQMRNRMGGGKPNNE